MNSDIVIIYNAKTQTLIRDYRNLDFCIMLDEMFDFNSRKALNRTLKTKTPVKTDNLAKNLIAFSCIEDFEKYKSNLLLEW